MAYTDFGFKNSPPSTTDLLPKWINAYRKLIYSNGWIKGRPLWSKRPHIGTAPNNYWAITCLPMMWKILTAQIKEEIYNSLISRGIFPDEQKGCRKRTKGTGELLCIDQHILNESETRRMNLERAWIDCKKGLRYGPLKPDTIHIHQPHRSGKIWQKVNF